MKIVRVFRDETFEEGGDNVVLTDAIDDLRVEILHFLAVAFMKNLLAIALLDVGCSRMAGEK